MIQRGTAADPILRRLQAAPQSTATTWARLSLVGCLALGGHSLAPIHVTAQQIAADPQQQDVEQNGLKRPDAADRERDQRIQELIERARAISDDGHWNTASERAIVELGRMGPKAQAAVPVLIEVLASQESYLRQRAVHSLAQIGEGAVPALGEALRSGEPCARAAAAAALARIGAPASQELMASIPALTAMLADRNKRTRSQAALACRWLDAPAADSLVEVLANADASQQTREAALMALGMMGSRAEAAGPQVLLAAEDSNAAVRAAARQALRAIDPGKARERFGDPHDATAAALADIATLNVARHDWPQWGGGRGRNNTPHASGLATDWDVETGRNIKWQVDLGSQTYANPAVANGKLFIGTNNGAGYLKRFPSDIDLGVLLCLEEQTGRLQWQLSRPKLATGRVHDWPLQGLPSTPLVDGERLWVTTNRGEVMCLDTEGFRDGENDGPFRDEENENSDEADVVWVFDMMARLGVSPHNMSNCSPICAGNLLFISTSNGVDEAHNQIPAPDAPSFMAMDRWTAEVVWTDSSPGGNILHAQWCSPSYAVLCGQAQVIFGGGDGWLYSFDPQGDGQGGSRLLWKFDCNPKESSYNASGRSERNSLIGFASVYDGLVYIAVGEDPEHGEGDGHLWCIDPTQRGDVSPELAVDEAGKPLPARRFQAVRAWSQPSPVSVASWDELDRGEVSAELAEALNSGPPGAWSVEVRQPGREWILSGKIDGADRRLRLRELAIGRGQDLRRRLHVESSSSERAIPNPNSAVVWHYDRQTDDGDSIADFEETFHRSLGTPTIKDDLLYIADVSGLFHCLNAKTGHVWWTHDLFAACWGSALVADGKVYIADEDGDVTIFRHGPALEILGEINMGASVYSTPTVANNVLYIANKTRLHAIRVQAETRWPQWRGPGGNGTAAARGVPATWSRSENVAWRTPLPGAGTSTPVVWDDRIFVTSVGSDGDALVLVAIGSDGQILWQREVGRGNRDIRNDEASFATPSPVTDGERVCALFGTGLLACYDFDGTELWRIDLEERYGKLELTFGLTSSPVLDGERLYLQLVHGDGDPDTHEARVLALEMRTGKEIWNSPRITPAREECEHSYASPIVYRDARREFLLTHGADYIIAHDLDNGAELWRCGGINPPDDYNPTLRLAASPVAVGETIVVPSAKAMSVLALRPDGSGDITDSPSVLWRHDRTPDLPSPLVHGGLVYLCHENGNLQCLHLGSGEQAYLQRVYADRYRSSPVYADGRLYLTSRDGTVTVVQAGTHFEVLAQNRLEEAISASPAVVEGRIYFRTHEALWAIGSRPRD